MQFILNLSRVILICIPMTPEHQKRKSKKIWKVTWICSGLFPIIWSKYLIVKAHQQKHALKLLWPKSLKNLGNVMMSKKVKELSAGIIFMTEDKELFMGRVTGSRKPGMPAHKWDIPKGHVEAGESPIEAAIRETEEETGFTQYDPAFLKDLGEFRYSDNKNLHLFLYTVPVEHEQFRHSKCSAYHTFPDGSSVPEFDAFALIKPSQWQYVMGKSMYKVLTQIFG
ncbi:nudix hydrolase [Escherichia phage CJ20]|nr:nudix hydrolase [Escherichia phage CJ20]